jgi:two-component system response regulator FixJ
MLVLATMLPLTHSVPGPSDPTVFVVDDDPAVLGSLKFSLETEGFRVKVFLTGRDLLNDGEALPRAACLVVDYNLAGTNGLDLIAALRAKGNRLPAILITSHPSTEVRYRATAAGIAVVEKPLLGNALSEAIRRAVDGN